MFGSKKGLKEVFFLPHCMTDYDLMPQSRESQKAFFLYKNGDAKAIECAKNELVLGTLLLSLAVLTAVAFLS